MKTKTKKRREKMSNNHTRRLVLNYIAKHSYSITFGVFKISYTGYHQVYIFSTVCAHLFRELYFVISRNSAPDTILCDYCLRWEEANYTSEKLGPSL